MRFSALRLATVFVERKNGEASAEGMRRLDACFGSYPSLAACSRVAWNLSLGQRSSVNRKFTLEVAR